MVEVYVLEAQGSPGNATDIYYQLTEMGQDYHIMGFHVVSVQTKGMQEVSKQAFTILHSGVSTIHKQKNKYGG